MRRFIVLAAIAALAGCSSPLRLNERSTLGALQVPIQLPSVEATRQDTWCFAGHCRPVDTGPLWAGVFVGKAGDPKLTIRSAKLTDATARYAGFAINFTYSVDSVLHLDGHDYPLHADGSRTSGIGLPMQLAVEDAIASTAKQAQMIVNLHTAAAVRAR